MVTRHLCIDVPPGSADGWWEKWQNSGGKQGESIGEYGAGNSLNREWSDQIICALPIRDGSDASMGVRPRCQ